MHRKDRVNEEAEKDKKDRDGRGSENIEEMQRKHIGKADER
jgi:hypothetical protein